MMQSLLFSMNHRGLRGAQRIGNETTFCFVKIIQLIDFQIFCTKLLIMVFLAFLCLCLSPVFSANIGVDLEHGNQVHLVPRPRSMWVWSPSHNKTWNQANPTEMLILNHKNSRSQLLDFCSSKSINLIYLYIGCWQWQKNNFLSNKFEHEEELSEFLYNARKRNIKVCGVFYINDESNNLSESPMAIEKIVDTVVNFNQKFQDGQFCGLQSDQEPGDPKVYMELLDMLHRGALRLKERSSSVFLSQAAKPKYLDHNLIWNGADKTMMQHVQDVTDHVALMSYSQYLNNVMKWSLPTLSYADKMGKKVGIGIELNHIDGWENADKESWFEEIRAMNLHDRFDKNNVKSFESIVLDLEKTFQSYPSFENMIIHSYRTYFSHWMCKDSTFSPSDYADLKASKE